MHDYMTVILLLAFFGMVIPMMIGQREPPRRPMTMEPLERAERRQVERTRDRPGVPPRRLASDADGVDLVEDVPPVRRGAVGGRVVQDGDTHGHAAFADRTPARAAADRTMRPIRSRHASPASKTPATRRIH